jgi:hypothetical protein
MGGNMARPPVGSVPQDQTNTALFAFLALRLAAVERDDYDSELAAMGLSVGANGAKRAGQRVRDEAREAGRDDPLTEWMMVDEHALGLEKVIIRVPGSTADIGRVRALLTALPVIRHLIEGEVTGDLYAVAVVRNGEERRDLRTQLDEMADPAPFMEPIRHEDQLRARGLWRELAQRSAPEEQLQR